MKAIVYLIIGVLVFGWLIKSCSSEPEVAEKKDYNALAVSFAKHHIKSRLKSPSTADFPYENNVTKKDDGTYEVKTYVDSQNGFGATVRSYWTVDVQYLGGDEGDSKSWNLVDIKNFQ